VVNAYGWTATKWPEAKGRTWYTRALSMPQCGKCHRDVAAGARYCPECGAALGSEQAPDSDPIVGRTLKDTYFVECHLGSGGMGHVYRALHLRLGKPVALKILRNILVADPATVQRFQREARAASGLRHPNVIEVSDFGFIEDGAPFIAMEFVAGRSLARIISEDSPIPEQRVVRIGAQILAALGEAHAARILHRDLKPANVMVGSRRDEADWVKVLDFGIAKILPAGGPGEGPLSLTSSGIVCGTPGYMSPETWNGEDLDARSDLYSVGVLLYEMLAGKLPFEAQTPMQLVKEISTGAPIPLVERRRGLAVSADLDALVMRALSSNRADRSASADEMRERLLACSLIAPGPAGLKRWPDTTVALPPQVLARRPAEACEPPGPKSDTPSPVDDPGRPPLAGLGVWLTNQAILGARRRLESLLGLAKVRSVVGLMALVSIVGLLVITVGRSLDHRPVQVTNPSPAPASPSPSPSPNSTATPTPAPAPTPAPTAIEDPTSIRSAARIRPARPCAARPTRFENGLGKIATPASRTGEGVLVVKAVPWGEAFVCGIRCGETPVELRVPAGTYRVQVKRASESEEKMAVVRAGQRRFVNFAKR
jgi:serine/threonine protein kinase